MVFEGLVIYGNFKYGNMFLGHVKVREETKALSDAAFKRVHFALQKNDRIVDARIEQFMKESTSPDGTVDKSKFICLVVQDIVLACWYNAENFRKLSKLGDMGGRRSTTQPGLLEMTPVAVQLKTTKEYDSRDHGYFIHKIEGYTGEPAYLDKVLSDTATYYRDTKGIQMELDECDSSFLPNEIPTMRRHPRRLVGVEDLSVKVKGLLFGSRTVTKLVIYENTKDKVALLFIHGRSLMGETDWDGKITGVTIDGTMGFIKEVMKFREEQGLVRNYDALHILSNILRKVE